MIKFVSNISMLQNGKCTAVINRDGRIVKAEGDRVTLPDGKIVFFYIGTYSDKFIGYMQAF